jgi:hypothetical protein
MVRGNRRTMQAKWSQMPKWLTETLIQHKLKQKQPTYRWRQRPLSGQTWGCLPRWLRVSASWSTRGSQRSRPRCLTAPCTTKCLQVFVKSTNNFLLYSFTDLT